MASAATVDQETFNCMMRYALARTAALNAMQGSELQLRYQLLRAGDVVTARSERAAALREDPDLRWKQPTKPFAYPDDDPKDSLLWRVPCSRRRRVKPGALTEATVDSLTWNVRRLETGWKGSPTGKAELSFSASTNKLLQKHAPQLIPGLMGTAGAFEHKKPPNEGGVAPGIDLSYDEFRNCVRAGGRGLGVLLGDYGEQVTSMDDGALRALFDRLDEDQSNSISFNEFYDTLERWRVEARAARDRCRMFRESVCWHGPITKREFIRRVRTSGRIGAFGRVEARLRGRRTRMLHQHSNAELADLFERIDENNDRSLTAAEFLAGLEALDFATRAPSTRPKATTARLCLDDNGPAEHPKSKAPLPALRGLEAPAPAGHHLLEAEAPPHASGPVAAPSCSIDDDGGDGGASLDNEAEAPMCPLPVLSEGPAAPLQGRRRPGQQPPGGSFYRASSSRRPIPETQSTASAGSSSGWSAAGDVRGRTRRYKIFA